MQPDTLNERVQRVWQLLESGDLDGADDLLETLRSEAPEAPGVVGLGAAMLASAGDAEGAVAELMRAFALTEAAAQAEADAGLDAPSDALSVSGVRFLLDAAELQLYALDLPEAAIESCQRALDLAIDEDALIAGVILEAEAFLSLGDHDDEVRELLAELDGCSIDDPAVLCRAGDQYGLMGDTADARRCFEKALVLEPGHADAYHGLGLVFEVEGKTEDQVKAFLRVRELDLAGPRPPWQLSDEAIEEVVESALAELPDEVRALLVNVPMFVEDMPDEQLIRDGLDPRLLGLFSGQPLPHQSHIVDGQIPTLERIQLFTRNLERASAGPEQFFEELRITVLHETAHFFGLEDPDLDDIGLG